MNNKLCGKGDVADQSIERRLLGLMLLSDSHIAATVRSGVKATHYDDDLHAEIHEAILDSAIDNRGSVDAVTLAEYLHSRHRLEAIGGVVTIAEIVDSVRATDRVPEIARLIRA